MQFKKKTIGNIQKHNIKVPITSIYSCYFSILLHAHDFDDGI